METHTTGWTSRQCPDRFFLRVVVGYEKVDIKAGCRIRIRNQDQDQDQILVEACTASPHTAAGVSRFGVIHPFVFVPLSCFFVSPVSPLFSIMSVCVCVCVCLPF